MTVTKRLGGAHLVPLSHSPSTALYRAGPPAFSVQWLAVNTQCLPPPVNSFTDSIQPYPPLCTISEQ